jgi:peroxiredoxin
MFPHERSLVKKMENKPFALLGVNSDTDREKLKEVLKKENITWRSFWNGKEGTKGPISTKWNVSGWPTLFVIDHKGVIRQKWLGDPGEKIIDDLLDKLVKEAEGGEKK